MDLDFEVVGNTLIISIDGEVDHHTSIELRKRIDNKISKISIKNIIFDFKNVNFMDSSGVGLIMGRYKNIEKIGGKVTVVNLNSKIKRVFEISGLFKLIILYESIDEALKNI